MDDAFQRIWSSRRTRRAGLYGPAALLVLVFIIDVNTPLGYAVSLGYAPAVLLSALTRRPAAVAAVALASMALTLAGIVLSPPALPGIPVAHIAFHRGVSLAGIVTCALLSIFVLRLVNRFAAASEMLDMAGKLGKLGGWRVDLRDRRVYWSNEVARIHGQPAGYAPTVEEGIGHYAPEYQELVRQRIDACMDVGAPFADDMQIITSTGERRWVRGVGRAVRNERQAVVAIQGAFQDIDARKAIETQLRQSLASWHSLAESMPMTVWTASLDGKIDYASQLLRDYSGLGNDQLLPSGWLNIIHLDDRAASSAAWIRSVQDLTPYETQFRVRRHDGEYRWHLTRAVYMPDSAAGPARWFGTSVDIDDQMRLQHEARTLADRLTATMESVGDAILILDSRWRVVFINRQGEILLDTSREQLIGDSLWSAFPEAVGSTFETEYRRCVEQRVAVRFEEYFAPLKKHFEINAYPAPDGLTIYFRDITQQRVMAGQMIQIQKLESLGRLTGGVAHDFNNLLTVILGNAEMLIEQATPGDTGHVLAEMILDAAQRGADMTQRLLAFARKQALEPVASDLNGLVSNTDKLLRHTLGGHIAVNMVRGAGLWMTLVDPGQLESALLNLAINARDAMPDGGHLTIETANVHLDEAHAAQHSGLVPGQYVMLAISDSGTGIAPDVLARVFEPFFTTKEVGKGTGLGLAMVYGFVMQSKGHIAIYSELGHGTTVKIYLPRLLNGTLAVAEDAAPEHMLGGHNELILLVEDDAMVRTFARGQLESLGYRVLEATSGSAALDLLRARDDIALLFTDVVMPGGMSGRQLADAATQLRPALPILYTSGYTEDAIIHQGRLAPGVILLSKPYRRAELAQKVSAALGAAAGTTQMETQ